MQKNRALASMHYMLNACVRRIWDGPIIFQRLQHFTTSKSSTAILWYVTFDIAPPVSQRFCEELRIA